MEPEAALSDRSLFESELDSLIDSAIRSEASSASARPPPSNSEDISNKRARVDSASASSDLSYEYSLHVHPSRQVLLNRPDSDKLRKAFSLHEYGETKSFDGRAAGRPYALGASNHDGRPSHASGANGTKQSLSNAIKRQ